MGETEYYRGTNDVISWRQQRVGLPSAAGMSHTSEDHAVRSISPRANTTASVEFMNRTLRTGGRSPANTISLERGAIAFTRGATPAIPTDATMESDPVSLQLALLPDETLVWQKGPGVGSGRFGQVSAALRLPSAQLLAVKQIFVQEELELGNDVSSLSLQRVQPFAQIERELDVLRLLQRHGHRNVLRFLGSERNGPTVNLFMELLPMGSLSKLLKDFGAMEEQTLRNFVRDVVRGVAHLHALGIAHRDLKCANLLLADDGVKIADFGTATRATEDEDRLLQTARSVREGLGSPFWMAPELVRAEKGADSWRKADIWGIGCVMIEMATGRPPWENLSNPLTAMFHIASNSSIPEFPAELSSLAKDFLSRCLDKNPDTRASATELLDHPFLREITEEEAGSNE
ncbi:hypothetical protein PRIC2_003382 [Phytophthora ramorum]